MRRNWARLKKQSGARTQDSRCVMRAHAIARTLRVCGEHRAMNDRLALVCVLVSLWSVAEMGGRSDSLLLFPLERHLACRVSNHP